MPLLSFLLVFVISEKYSWIISFTAPFLHLISALGALVVFLLASDELPYVNTVRWFSLADGFVHAGVLVNSLAGTMLLVVTFVSLLVHIYSTGYMAGDRGIRRYFAMLGLFTFAMMVIVVADNLLLLFVGWELVGFSSYMLIGHWTEKPSAARAAKKAFILNRVGDAGFLIGLMIIWTNHQSFAVEHLTTGVEGAAWQTAAALCLFCGVIGKSAQFPLLNWLPDAMEGPTPVSALIHAATMVAAGVYLIIRIFPLFTPDALTVVAAIGVVTALLGALAALGQYDIKKILAYSTISQLGLMITALGAGNSDASFVHLFTHAFFKAGLFLAAGSVIHSLHQSQQQAHAHFDVQDIRNLGGLRKKLPTVFAVFVVAGGSLAGLPFFSGFLSKDAILTAIISWAHSGLSWKWFVIAGVFAVSFITVLYTFRMIWTVFLGEEKRTNRLQVHEPPIVMQAPIIVLAVCSLWIIISWNPFAHTRWHSLKIEHNWVVTIFSMVWVLSGLVTAYITRMKSFHSLVLFKGFYLDEVVNWISRKVIFNISRITDGLDRRWLDGAIHITAYAQVIVAHFTGWIDRAIVDGSVNGVAGVVRSVGSLTRSFQAGKIQLYIFWSVFTIIIFLIWTLL
jgi:NADH-quinone oxidoreductase subunit L